MAVTPGDKLDMTFELIPGSTNWKQTVLNTSSGKSVIFTFDLQGQNQGLPSFIIEHTNGWDSNPPSFTVTNIEIRAAGQSGLFCSYEQYVLDGFPGATIDCAAPVINGLSCLISSFKFNGGDKAIIPTTISTLSSQNPSSTSLSSSSSASGSSTQTASESTSSPNVKIPSTTVTNSNGNNASTLVTDSNVRSSSASNVVSKFTLFGVLLLCQI